MNKRREKITGKHLIKWGFEPGEEFSRMLIHANKLKDEGFTYAGIRRSLKQIVKDLPKLLELRENPIEWSELIDVETEEEEQNLDAVRQAMSKAMKVPVIKAGVIMPDACPAGTAPVGSVIASEMIHPGLHSADICCSVACSVFDNLEDADFVNLIDSAQKSTHFGIGSNTNIKKDSIYHSLAIHDFPYKNYFIGDLADKAINDIGTQGDGNHFLFIGTRESDGKVCLVTHHGSRSFGAALYKRGMTYAKRATSKVAKGIDNLSWFDPETEIGKQYWEALQYVRQWTKYNHLAVHSLVANNWKKDYPNIASSDMFWNEHNFIFRKEDGLYYHAKGATPNYENFSEDDCGLTLVPLNMGEPILLLGHTNNEKSLGFAPHGAGRNLSRTKFLQNNSPEEPEGIEVRFYSGKPDKSELPDAYKPAQYIIDHIESKGIGTIVDRIMPQASLMAGDFDWKNKRKDRKRERKQ